MNNSSGIFDFLYVLKKYSWILLIGLVVFVLLIPFSTAALPGNTIFNIDYTHDQIKFRLFHEDMVYAIIGAAVLLGAVTGIALFRFLLDKKESTIFLSLGITRKRLFINRLIVSAIYILLAIAAPMLISVILNINALGIYQGLIRNSIYITLGLFICSMVSMCIGACCVFISGTLAECIVYWAGIISLPTIICYSLNLIFKEMFWGNPYGEIYYSGVQEAAPSLLSKFTICNPILFFAESLNVHGQFDRPLTSAVPEEVNWKIIIIWFVVCMVLAAAAYILIMKRRAESAGFTCEYRAFSEGLIALTSLLAVSAVFSLLNKFSTLLAVIISVLACAAVNLFWRISLFSSHRRITVQIISFAVQITAMAMIFLFCCFGLQAISSSFLETADIVQADVIYVGDPDLIYADSSGSSSGSGYYLTSSMELKSPEAIESAVQIHKDIIAAGCLKIGNGDDIEDTVVPYDISFKYIDSAGTEHIWYYDRISFSELEMLLKLEDTDEIKTAQTDVLDIGANVVSRAAVSYRNSDIYLSDPWLNNIYKLDISSDLRQQLLNAVKEDVKSLSSDERYFPESSPVAVLMFTTLGEQDYSYFTYHLDNSFIYITDAYVKTVSWLKSNDLLELTESDPDIEYVILQKFNPYIGINTLSKPMGLYFMAYRADSDDDFIIRKDFGNQYTISKTEQIEEIRECLVDSCYMTRGGYLACVKLRNDDKFRYMFLPAWNIPDFIR